MAEITKDTFTFEEWGEIISIPSLAGSMIMVSDLGITSMFGETKAMMEAMLRLATEGAATSSLLAAMKEQLTAQPTDEQKSAAKQMQEAQKEATKDVKSKEQMKEMIMKHMQETTDMMVAKGATPEDMLAFKNLVYGVAVATAEAGREGGFLGIGSKRVSEKEEKALVEIKTALGI